MRRIHLLSIVALLFLAACSRITEAPVSGSSGGKNTVVEVAQSTHSPYEDMENHSATQPRLAITVHKTASCGCCGAWVDHLRRNNFEVEVVDHVDLAPLKKELGVKPEMASCHTAMIEGMYVEGHVPAGDIRRMLEVAPDAAGQIKGIAVPGMPIGSPGMEVGNRIDPYQVLMIDGTGEVIVFSEYGI